MPKKDKGYRKVRKLRGTIFDKKMGDVTDDVVTRQRRWGFWYERGINPATVSSSADAHPVVESIGNGRVRVYYDAVYLPPDEERWPEGRGGHLAVPAGIFCERGGYHKRHIVTQIKSVEATLAEVLA